MDSDTSDDFNYLNTNNPKITMNNKMENNKSENNKQPPKKNLTTDTDFHLQYLANPAKIKIDLDANDSENNNDSESNVSKFLDNINDNSSDTSIIIGDDDDDELSESSEQKTTNANNSRQDVKQSVLVGNKNDSSHRDSRSSERESSVPKKILSEKELRFKKIELLRKLSEIKASGYDLSKDYNFNSDIEEMEYEYDLLKSMKDKQNGVGLYKSFMLNAITAMEFLNDRYDPFDFKLSGWSEHMNVGIDDYSDVFGEIYEKYRGTGKKMEPEIKLLLMVAASGASFHASNTMFKKLPGLEKLIKENPALLSKLTTQVFNDNEKTDSQFMTRQEINAQEQIKHNQLKQQQIKQEQMQRQEELRKEQAIRQHLLAQQQQQMFQQQQQQQQFEQQQQHHQLQQLQPQQQQQPNMKMPTPTYQVNNAASVNRNSLNNNQSQSIQFQRQQEIDNMAVNGEISGPTNVEHILNKVKKEKLNDNTRITISDESSSNDRVVSSSTFQNDSNQSSKKGRKKKKNNISIIT
jgi:hypothetical protein